MVFAGYIILAISLFIIITGNWILGSILTLFAVFISFSFSGLEIDISKNRYKEFSVYFGIKIGKWLSLDKYIYLSVLCNKEIYETHGRANVTTSDSIKYFEVYMLDITHAEKLLIKKFKDPDIALKYAEYFSGVLNMELTDYNPPLSSKTILNRYRR